MPAQPHGSLYLLARAGCWLSIRCMGCAKVSEVDPQPFVDRFWRRVDTSLDSLGDRFRCTSCGYKGAILSAIDGPPATYAIKVPIPIYRRVNIWKNTTGRVAASYDQAMAELLTAALDAAEVPIPPEPQGRGK